MMRANSPVAWFEIVVKDMPKAVEFYQNVLGYTFEKAACPSDPEKKIEMMLFPYTKGYPGGALVCGEAFNDHQNGPGTTILYLDVESIGQTLEKVVQNQGQVTFPCTPIGENGFIAGFADLDGNAIGIWSMAA